MGVGPGYTRGDLRTRDSPLPPHPRRAQEPGVGNGHGDARTCGERPRDAGAGGAARRAVLAARRGRRGSKEGCVEEGAGRGKGRGSRRKGRAAPSGTGLLPPPLISGTDAPPDRRRRGGVSAHLGAEGQPALSGRARGRELESASGPRGGLGAEPGIAERLPWRRAAASRFPREGLGSWGSADLCGWASSCSASWLKSVVLLLIRVLFLAD